MLIGNLARVPRSDAFMISGPHDTEASVASHTRYMSTPYAATPIATIADAPAIIPATTGHARRSRYHAPSGQRIGLNESTTPAHRPPRHSRPSERFRYANHSGTPTTAVT